MRLLIAVFTLAPSAAGAAPNEVDATSQAETALAATASAPATSWLPQAGDQALVWLDYSPKATRVVIDRKTSCLRVRWTGEHGPCSSEGRYASPHEELFFIELPQETNWPVSLANPKKPFPKLPAGAPVVKQIHSDSECDRTYRIEGDVMGREECFSVFRLTPYEHLAPMPATEFLALPPGPATGRALVFDDVQRVIKGHVSELKNCVIANHVAYLGNWAVNAGWIIKPDGQVWKRTRTGHDERSASPLEACVAEQIARWTFAKSDEGMRVEYRFDQFNPRDPTSPGANEISSLTSAIAAQDLDRVDALIMKERTAGIDLGALWREVLGHGALERPCVAGHLAMVESVVQQAMASGLTFEEVVGWRSYSVFGSTLAAGHDVVAQRLVELAATAGVAPTALFEATAAAFAQMVLADRPTLAPLIALARSHGALATVRAAVARRAPTAIAEGRAVKLASVALVFEGQDTAPLLAAQRPLEALDALLELGRRNGVSTVEILSQDNYLAFDLACRSGDLEMVNHLVELAKSNAVPVALMMSARNYDAFFAASLLRRFEVQKRLVELGAENGLQVADILLAPDSSGSVGGALRLAARRGDLQEVELVLDLAKAHGVPIADVALVRPCDGCDAFALALRQAAEPAEGFTPEHQAIVQLLYRLARDSGRQEDVRRMSQKLGRGF